MDLKVLHDKIFIFEKAIPNAKEMFDHFDIINNLAVSEWDEWRDDHCNRNYGKTKSFHQKYWNEKDCDLKSLNYLNQFRSTFEKCAEIYAEKNKVKVKMTAEKNFAISVYEKDSELGLHIDTPDNWQEEEHSILIYWTDQYQGGELYFDKYNTEFKPNAGDIIFFSSTDKDLLHGTKLVTSGVKAFTIQMWSGAGKGYVPLCKCDQCLKRPGRCGADKGLYK